MISNKQADNLDNSGDKFIVMGTITHFDWVLVDEDESIRSMNWSTIDGSSICPDGFRVPTVGELEDIGSAPEFISLLKLPYAGLRNDTDGRKRHYGIARYLWSSEVNNYNFNESWAVLFGGNTSNIYTYFRMMGIPVCCIQDN